MQEIKCDQCNEDLTCSKGATKYKLTLSCEKCPSDGPCVSLLLVLPPIERDYHFCGLKCLFLWIDEQEISFS